MRRRCIVLLLLAAALPASGQDCSPAADSHGRTFGVTSIALMRTTYTNDGTIQQAIDYWNTGCPGMGGSAFPSLTSGTCTSATCAQVEVRFEAGRSRLGGCGEYQANQEGPSTGGIIVVWEVDLWGRPCAPDAFVTIAHEMGHMLGLGDAPGTPGACLDRIMGPPTAGQVPPLHGDDCDQADAGWQQPSEPDDDGGNPDDPPLNDDCGAIACSPLVLDLNGDGVHTTPASEPVTFDIDADGIADRIGWTDPRTEEGFLWIDRNHDHVVNDGSELFGIATPLPDGSTARHGFLALQSFDDPANGGNGDGVITVADAVWARLRLWIDRDHDGISTPTEVGPIQAYGITALGLTYVTDFTPDDAGNEHRYRGWYLRRVVGDGPARVRVFALDDVFFAREP